MENKVSQEDCEKWLENKRFREDKDTCPSPPFQCKKNMAHLNRSKFEILKGEQQLSISSADDK